MRSLTIVVPFLVALSSALPNPAPQSGSTCTTSFTDRIIFSSSMTAFQSAKRSQTPSGCNWTDDGCSYSPDRPFGFEFLPSCQRHDFGYRNFKAQGRFTETNRKRVDDNFLADLRRQCATEGDVEDCNDTAQVYYAAVREFGGKKKGLEVDLVA